MRAHEVTIIVPTLAERERRAGLFRALDSVRAASLCVSVRILVVVNGSRFDDETVAMLSNMGDVEICQIERGSLSHALWVGRCRVETPFFGFLDDDDEYLEGAIDCRLAALRDNPDASLAVSNGYRRLGERDQQALAPLDKVETDPLGSLFRSNWLASCNGLFRSQFVSKELFQDINPYTEWTWLAFRISLSGLKIVAINDFTFRIHDTVGSESKSDAYREAFLGLFDRMLGHAPPKHIARQIQSCIASSHHDLSDLERKRGNLRKAWQHHLASLKTLHGWHHLLYTRHLIRATLLHSPRH